MDDFLSPEEREMADGVRTIRFPAVRRERGRMAGRLRILSVADARAAPPRDYLLDGLLGVGEASVWWGTPKKAAKTFLLLRVAYGLALGLGMWGREACKCAVLYVAAEGQGGIHGRIAALADALGEAPWFRYVAQGVDLLDPEADTEALAEAGNALLDEIERETGERPRLLIVVDTYHRTAPGAEENSARDAGRYLANVDRLREGTGAHVAVIHHGADRPRGSTAIDGAADLLMHVQKAEDGTHRATVAGAKDDESGAVLTFQLRVVDLPPGARGRARTTCVAEEREGGVPLATEQSAGRSFGRGEAGEEAEILLRDIENLIASGQGRHDRPEPGMPVVPTIAKDRLLPALVRSGWLRVSAASFRTGNLTETPGAIPAQVSAGVSAGVSAPETVPKTEMTRLWKRLDRLKLLGLVGFNRQDVWLARAPDPL